MHFFHEKLAVEIGINDAVFLQNIYYLCKNNLLKEKIDKNLNISITMSRTNILEYQKYFSTSTIRNITKRLIKFNLIEVDQINKSVSNSLSYSLTPKGWSVMFFLEKPGERRKIEATVSTFDKEELFKFVKQVLKKTENVSCLPDLLSTSWDDMPKLTDIIIEYRNLIESDRNIEIMDLKNSKDFKKHFYEIENMISQNIILKNRIEKTFEDVKNYINRIIVPAIKKFGILKVLKVVKETVSGFLPTYSPVFNFYANLERLIIHENNY
ncbi:MAG: hypothetical protein ACRC18_07320 [Cetobacterium sp.]